MESLRWIEYNNKILPVYVFLNPTKTQFEMNKYLMEKLPVKLFSAFANSPIAPVGLKGTAKKIVDI